MRLLDLLAKLGILRWGWKAGVYRSGRDRPVEFLLDDVYNAKRDLTTKEDLKDMARMVGLSPKQEAASPGEARRCPVCARDVSLAARFCPGCGQQMPNTHQKN
ncbi:MAG TPA: hypothetical protein PLQ11_00325 [Beijerinckiaceae bacterium]|nr:hypothetical protein [Beijerinckiaceae bacterium]